MGLACLPACGKEPAGEPEVADVFAAAWRWRSGPLVVRRVRAVPWHGRPEAVARGVRAELQALRPDTWDSFVSANAAPSDVTTSLRFPDPVTTLSEEDLAEVLADEPDDFWAAFSRRFPDAHGLLSVSMPGRSADGRQVLLYVEHMGPGCDPGHLYLLAWRDGAWHVVDFH